MRIRLTKCFRCGKIIKGKNYVRIDYPQKSKEHHDFLAIDNVCDKCLKGHRKGDFNIIESLKGHKEVTIYDLERLGLIKELKGEIREY